MMEHQQAQKVEQALRQNWQRLRYEILDQFGQVGTADLDNARNINDLVRRIADKSRHSEHYVENRLQEMAGAGAGGQQGGGGGQPFGRGGQQGQAQDQPFGASQQ